MQVASITSPVPHRGAVVRPILGRLSAGFVRSLAHAFVVAAYASSAIDGLSPTHQRDVALGWLHRSDPER
jgi:hypothetical protein